MNNPNRSLSNRLTWYLGWHLVSVAYVVGGGLDSLNALRLRVFGAK